MANDFVRFARSVEYSTGKKRGRRPVFNANRFYPHALERELASLAKSELERFLSECTEAALIGIPVRDDMEELSKVPETLPESFVAGVGGVAEKMRRKASTDFAEWSEMVVGKPYYPPEAEREIFSTWTANFQTLCRSAEADAKKDISMLVTSAKNEGWNLGRLEKAIKAKLPKKYRSRAELIARTETGKLNSAAKLSQFREVGISYYKWLTTIDGRERDSHRSMNGLICSVSDPDVYYTENPEDPLHPVEHPRTADMFRGNPGEDFQCRCSMVAWDPEIDGSYEIKESPEKPDGEKEPGTPPESAESARLGAELEKARREREEAETSLKNAENAKKETERKLKILQTANRRHIERSTGYREELMEKLRARRKNWEVKCSLPSESWNIVKSVGKTYETAVKDMLSNRPSEYLTACRLLKNSVNINVKPKTAYFTSYNNKISLYMGCASSNPLGPGKTILHEHGHALDYAIGVACGYGKEISEALEFGKGVAKELQRKLFKEADQFIKKNDSIFPFYYDTSDKRRDYFRAKFIKGCKLPNGEFLSETVTMPFATLETATKKIRHSQESAAISDIINGVSRGKMSLGYGHSNSYWNFNSIGWESFTHFGTLSESDSGLAFLKKYLAEQLDQWKQMIKLGADKAPSLENAIKSR
jgi:SPP1 gp7 family putative phage head morphogenesis protein